MLGYNYTLKNLDTEINERLGLIPRGLWTEEDKELNRSLTLANWDTAGYNP